MANDYTEFSTFISLKTAPEREWVKKTLSNPPDDLCPNWCEPEDNPGPEFIWDLVVNGAEPGVHIYSEGWHNPEAVETFFKKFLAEAPTELRKLGCQFCFRCDKPRPDHFGGSAVVVWVGDDGEVKSDWMSTNSWLSEKMS